MPDRVRRGGAHPRPCGEHRSDSLAVMVPAGSSPPVRGAHEVEDVSDDGLGLIPARAGSTSLQSWNSEQTRAHPRPCGEHDILDPSGRVVLGSSPPVRGAHLLTWGFIPYTGKIGLLWSQSLRPEYTINNCS